MDLRSLKIFIDVAELRSFTRAGEKLGYSQPTISFQIKQLEAELGFSLFDRIGHTVSLTDAGREALGYAQNIVMLSQEMSLGARDKREAAGLVRLGMADSLCSPIIVGHFARFRERYPLVSLSVTTAGTAELFRLLDHNEVDIVCTFDSHIYDSAYINASEESVAVHFVASPQNPLARQKAITLEGLSEQPVLLTEKGMSYRRLLDEELARSSIELHPILEMGSADGICRLVEQNVGVSFLPDYVTAEAVKAGRLVRLELQDFRPQVWRQLLYRKDKWVSLQMRAMIKELSGVMLES